MLDINFTKKLRDFDLKIELKSDDKLIAIVGKSGSGKTTLIRCIAGLEKIDKGYINCSSKISILFQNYALFPNMSVIKNLQFANNNPQKIDKLIKLMELEGLEDRYPDNLSGGEKQRVALARALVTEPKVLLLDEPFSALNYELKQKLYKEIEYIKNNFDIQIVLISHDIGEVYRLADRVVELENGKIIKDFIPEDNFAKLISKEKNEILIQVKDLVYKIKL
jgi:molybdate transport system ATP-binding protein